MSETKVVRDPDFDINSLLRTSTASEEEPKSEETKNTPLDTMVSNTKEKGLVVSNAELAANAERPKRSHIDNDDRLKEYETELDAYDDDAEKIKYLIQKKSVTNELEHAELIDELGMFTVEGLKDLQEKYPNGAKLKGKYFNLAPIKKEDSSNSENIESNTANNQPSTKPTNDENHEDDYKPIDEINENDIKRQNIVKVLIDKTNLGVPPIFNEVESEKIFNAERVDLVEVETVELESLVTNKPSKSFMESVREYDSIGSQVPMIFPCSRFRATINGLSNGEMGDIALSVSNTGYESENKKLSIIYNKIKNCSFGKFDSYEDFLENFAHIDIPMALYALYVATSPEEDHITLRCGNDGCNKTFNAPFRSRSLLRLNLCSDAFLNNMDIVSDAGVEKAQEIFKNAPHRKEKMFKLPNSKWIVSIGYITCREYLDVFAGNETLEDFQKTHPDDTNGTRFLGMQFIRMVRSISIPNPEGRYVKYTDPNDIIDAMYYMNSDDFQILNTIIDRYINDYTPVFGIEKVTCPHCGSVSEFVEVDIEELVFRTYRRRLSTTVNLKKLEDL